MFKGLKITPEEAAIICSKSQYGEVSFLDVIRLKLHFLGNKKSVLFSKQNTTLSKICSQHLVENKQTKPYCLSEKDKAALKEKWVNFTDD